MADICVNHTRKHIVLNDTSVDLSTTIPGWKTTDSIGFVSLEYHFKILLELITYQGYRCDCMSEFDP